MTDRDPIEAMREVAREVLREVVPEILAEAGTRRHENGHHAPSAPDPAVPRVPPPPVAAVLRPSTWTGPAVPGEVIGDGDPASADPDPDPERTLIHVKPHRAAQRASGQRSARVEPVTLDTDEDLAHFVRALLARFDSPREKRDIRAGRIRFTLAPTQNPAAPQNPGTRQNAATTAAATLHIPKGAVTERVVRDAADRGARLVLGRGAVLTPLARDQARALGVEIEKEGRC